MKSLNITKAYIRFRANVPESQNNFAAYDGFSQLGIEIEPFYGFNDLQEKSDLGPNTCVSGFIVDVWNVLNILNIPIPEALDYPDELKAFLGRNIRKDILGSVRNSTQKVFVKPIEQKVFSGLIWDNSITARKSIVTIGDDVPVWVSDPVNFLSEYRGFVLDGQILDIRRYKGDWSYAPNKNVVETAVMLYKNAPRAYSLDFGITDTGETLLVEANDSYALGHYGLNSVLYARMIAARWEELMA